MKPLQNLDTTGAQTIVQAHQKKSLTAPHPNDSLDAYVANPKNYLFVKRGLDLLFSVLMVLLVLSWLLPLLAILIKADSKGPVFFKQRRVGRDGKLFRCLKLRTMISNNEADELPVRENDDRITKLGVFLRATHLDELPQFFNVICGDMSVVGPRPHMPADCIRFSFVIPSYSSRHSVKPGITGWAQVKGYHGPTTDYESVIDRYYWDSQYIKKAGLDLDIRIMFTTACKGMREMLRLFRQH